MHNFVDRYTLVLYGQAVAFRTTMRPLRCTKREWTNFIFITFRVSRRRREMYCGHARLYVCVSVPRRMPTRTRM